MKLIASLDRACETRMRSAARPRLLMLALIGFAFIAPLLSGSAIAAATGADKPASMVATAGMLGGLALTGPLREEDPGAPQGGGSDPTKADDDQKLTIGQRLSAAIASKATLQAEISDLKSKLATAESAIEANQKTFESMAADLNAANEKITALETDAAEIDRALKSAEAEAKDLKSKEASAEKKAQETVASLGFPAASLPAAQEVDPDAAVPATRADLEEQMAKLPNLQARADLLTRFNAAHKAA